MFGQLYLLFLYFMDNFLKKVKIPKIHYLCSTIKFGMGNLSSYLLLTVKVSRLTIFLSPRMNFLSITYHTRDISHTALFEDKR